MTSFLPIPVYSGCQLAERQVKHVSSPDYSRTFFGIYVHNNEPVDILDIHAFDAMVNGENKSIRASDIGPEGWHDSRERQSLWLHFRKSKWDSTLRSLQHESMHRCKMLLDLQHRVVWSVFPPTLASRVDKASVRVCMGGEHRSCPYLVLR